MKRHDPFANLSDTERADLIASLDEAEAQVDAGEVYTADQLRKNVKAWAKPGFADDEDRGTMS